MDSLFNLSSNNKEILNHSKLCGCFYCLRMFNFEEIEYWIDKENTAICPYCFVDSVIPYKDKKDCGKLVELKKIYFKDL